MIKNHSPDLGINHRPKNYMSAHGPFHCSNSIFQFYGGGGRGELLDKLCRHVQNSDEPVLVRGEPGSGKTMLCQLLSHRLKQKYTVVRYAQAKISADRLLHHVVSEIWPLHAQALVAQLTDSATSAPSPKNLSFAELRRAVAEHNSDLKPILLLIDTPDQIDFESQVFLDRLGTIQRGGFAVFRIVVMQNCPHDVQTNTDNMEQDWGITTFTLRRLSLAEIHDYLEHHMLLFDFHKRNMFTREMSYFIADRSEGVIRAINLISRNAFMLASIENDNEVTMSHLMAAGLPQKEEPRKSRLTSVPTRIIRYGGLKFAIAVSSIVVLSVTWWLTQI